MKIFLSYRRDDSIHITGRIYDRLVVRFGVDHVFKDIDSIPLGADFRHKIREAVERCDAFIAVLGDRWLNIADESGRRRLDHEDDFVRLEVLAALGRGIPIVPLLVGRAPMPRAEELPDAIRDLAFRNGMPVRPDPDFHRDVDRVIRALEQGPRGSDEAGPAKPREVTNSVGMKLVFLPPGRFVMGSPAGEGKPDEEPAHEVTLSRPFYLGACPVTQAQYVQLAGQNPSRFKGGGNAPVESVTWFEAIEYCNRLSRREGLGPCYAIDGEFVEMQPGNGYRLATEAEWEYACRAGSTTAWFFGPEHSPLAEYAWYWDNAGGKPQPVAQKLANPWGLYDMHGNVWEWCWDWYHPYAAGPQTDPIGPHDGAYAVVRGGSWNNYAFACRSACRFRQKPKNRSHSTGFRLLREAE